MDRMVNEFVGALRAHHVRVSPSETLDALGGLRSVGVGDRETVRDTLRATLVKRSDDVDTFEHVFELFFDLRGHVHDHHHHHHHPVRAGENPVSRFEFGEDPEGEPPPENPHEHSHADDEATDLRRFLPPDKLRSSPDLHGATDKMRMSFLAQDLVLQRTPGALDQALQKISHHLKVRRARGVFAPGGLVAHTGAEELPIDLSAGDLEALVDHLEELEVEPELIRELTAASEEILRGLPELVRAMSERRRRLAAPGDHDPELLHSRSLSKLMSFSAGEQRELEAAIRRLGRRIHGAHSRRLRRDRTGRISVAHTLRSNLRYDGIPFDPVLRRRREERPRLVLLCDLSLSTRNLARFWLHLVYQLQSLFSKVRTFVFVADIVEVSRLLEEEPLDRAVAQIFSGRLFDTDVSSDFGKAAERFVADELHAVSKRSTVVVLGDGRNNGRAPAADALEEIRRHARRLIWITPEPRWGWTLGSCDMPLYEPICDRVEVVRTAEQLAAAAERLVSDGVPG